MLEFGCKLYLHSVMEHLYIQQRQMWMEIVLMSTTALGQELQRLLDRRLTTNGGSCKMLQESRGLHLRGALDKYLWRNGKEGVPVQCFGSIS